jgi:hypothetical protein
MNPEDVITLVKAKIAEDLEKQGHSLLDLEEALIKKEAGGIIGDAVNSALSNFPEIVLSSALLGGTTLGGVAYAANKHIRDQDKALNERRQEVDRYRQLTDKVKMDYDLNG